MQIHLRDPGREPAPPPPPPPQSPFNPPEYFNTYIKMHLNLLAKVILL